MLELRPMLSYLLVHLEEQTQKRNCVLKVRRSSGWILLIVHTMKTLLVRGEAPAIEGEIITANVRTKGVNKKFPFWELLHRADRFPHISLSFGRITLKHVPFFQNNSCTISDVTENTKMHFISPFGTGASVSVQHLLGGWALVQTH
jgi:hypothetical protein